MTSVRQTVCTRPLMRICSCGARKQGDLCGCCLRGSFKSESKEFRRAPSQSQRMFASIYSIWGYQCRPQWHYNQVFLYLQSGGRLFHFPRVVSDSNDRVVKQSNHRAFVDWHDTIKNSYICLEKMYSILKNRGRKATHCLTDDIWHMFTHRGVQLVVRKEKTTSRFKRDNRWSDTL